VLHRFDLFWRFHRTHHSDQDFDFTTSVRFHPLEAIYTRSFMLGTTFLLGPPAEAVVFTELLSMMIAFFEHGNIRLSPALDRMLRRIVVTPDMHRIHHSVRAEENSRNFGNIAPWWDRLFGTYLDQPADGHEAMAVGLPELMNRKHLTLRWMLIQPGLPIAPEESVVDTRFLKASRVQTHN
jgi:sterol desaturase/sphingolipid hydroxylase (fatty acid hydroxylase superfamily)